jgi:hypothetical protein
MSQAVKTDPAPEQLAAHEVEGEWRQLLQPHDCHLALLALALTLSMQLVEHLQVCATHSFSAKYQQTYVITASSCAI